ncbi:MAG: MerR family transcriptional regulator, partial [Actinomycetota bacterium]|nr:MerR family transcriptional regulator [Actinomycetota bacterium]
MAAIVEVAQPRYAVSAVAHRLGVAPATLRTWARRYGLGPSLHEAGSHRRYSAQDVARLQ